MAIIPSTDYAGQIDTSDLVGYPHGKAKNVTTAGDGTGTPLEAAWVNDVWGFLQQLLDLGGVTPSGNADKVGTSDYWDALLTAVTDAFPIRYASTILTGAGPTASTIWGPTHSALGYNGNALEVSFSSALVTNSVQATVFVNSRTTEHFVTGFVDPDELGLTIKASNYDTGEIDLSTWGESVGVVVLGTKP